MRTASKDFGDLVAERMKEFQLERGKADPQIYKDTKSQAAIVFHVDDPILASSHQQTARVWKRVGEHVLLKAHEVMTCDGPIRSLSRRYVRVHAHGRRGFKVRLFQEYFDSIATAMDMVSCGTRAVPGRKKAGPTAGRVGQDQRMLGASAHSRYRAGVGKTAVHDKRSATGSLRSEELVEATGKAVGVGHAGLEAVCGTRWDTATIGCT